MAEASEKDFASAVEVGKCDTGRGRSLHAHNARAAGGDQKEGLDRPAQQAKGNEHCFSHAVNGQCRYDLIGRHNEYWPARPKFRCGSFNRDLRGLTEQICSRALTHHRIVAIAPAKRRAESCQLGSCAAAARAFMASRCRSARSRIR
jgi:hypothetical protein